jgi:hypothetical protein
MSETLHDPPDRTESAALPNPSRLRMDFKDKDTQSETQNEEINPPQTETAREQLAQNARRGWMPT